VNLSYCLKIKNHDIFTFIYLQTQYMYTIVVFCVLLSKKNFEGVFCTGFEMERNVFGKKKIMYYSK